uniref:Protein involved in innate immunity and lipid metabolism n=1 Tax=Lutzomyia longipalpis TaxID=7200 RepID=A0A1B0CC78_LUTLO
MLRFAVVALCFVPAILAQINVLPCPQGNLPISFELVSCSHGPCPPLVEDTIMNLRIGIRTNYITTRLPAYVVLIVPEGEINFPLETGDACVNIPGYCDPYLPAGDHFFDAKIMVAGVPINEEFTTRVEIFDDNNRSVACGQMPLVVQPRA